jgi:hypothetical protein
MTEPRPLSGFLGWLVEAAAPWARSRYALRPGNDPDASDVTVVRVILRDFAVIGTVLLLAPMVAASTHWPDLVFLRAVAAFTLSILAGHMAVSAALVPHDPTTSRLPVR